MATASRSQPLRGPLSCPHVQVSYPECGIQVHHDLHSHPRCRGSCSRLVSAFQILRRGPGPCTVSWGSLGLRALPDNHHLQPIYSPSCRLSIPPPAWESLGSGVMGGGNAMVDCTSSPTLQEAANQALSLCGDRGHQVSADCVLSCARPSSDTILFLKHFH